MCFFVLPLYVCLCVVDTHQHPITTHSLPTPPHTATPPSPTPRPGSAMAAAAEFSTLQSYIADLEKEKFELLQQLQQQHSTLHTLESEREELVIQFNSQGKQVSGLQEQITRLQQEIGGQVAVVEQMARERDAAKNAARETGLRAKVCVCVFLGGCWGVCLWWAVCGVRMGWGHTMCAGTCVEHVFLFYT